MKFIQVGTSDVVAEDQIVRIDYLSKDWAEVRLQGSSSIVVNDEEQLKHLEEQLGVTMKREWLPEPAAE